MRGIRLAVLASLSLAILPAQALLEGDIFNHANNAPLAGARVKLDRLNDDSLYAKADLKGHFRFPNLPPGSYQLIAESPGYFQTRASVDLTVPRPAGRGGVLGGIIGGVSAIPAPQITKSVDADGTVHCTASVPLMAYAVLTGRVTDPFGDPLSNASIEIHRKRQPGDTAGLHPTSSTTVNTMVDTDSRGEFRAARLAPGTYWVLANRGSSRTWESTFRITYYPAARDLASAKAIDLAAGQQVRADIQILRQAGVKVSGHLFKPAYPLGSFLSTSIILTPVNNTAINADRPSGGGDSDYTLTDVLPGRYVVTAQTVDVGADPVNPNRKPLFGVIKEVEIGAQDVAGLDLTLEPMKGLNGKVEFHEGCKASPVTVRLQSEVGMWAPQAEVVTDSQNKFVLSSVAAGRYTVSVSSRMAYLEVTSAVMGARDILQQQLEAPWKGDDPLVLKVDCGARGRQQ